VGKGEGPAKEGCLEERNNAMEATKVPLKEIKSDLDQHPELAQLAREQTEVSVLHDPSIAAADREKEVEKELAEPMSARENVFLTIDPLEFARGVHCPALVLQGGRTLLCRCGQPRSWPRRCAAMATGM
jgi:hypothetical protein